MSEPQKNLWESAKAALKGVVAPVMFRAFITETEGALLIQDTLYVKANNE